MSDEKDTTTAVDVEIVTKARKIILGVSPIEFLRPHEPETLAEGALATGKSADITPAELAELIANGGDLEEDIQKLIKARQLQTQLSGISFSAREAELIGKSFHGITMFIDHVVVPLLEKRDDYYGVWLLHRNRASPWGSVAGIFGNQTDKQDENLVPAREILSHMVAEVQLHDPDNNITPLIIEALSRILPPQACEEFSNTLREILSA